MISPDQLPDGQVGDAYSAAITATGGLGAPYTFTLDGSSGPLPPGLSLAADGTITGTPTQAGTFPFTVSVDDPVLKNYSIVITAPASSPPVSSPPASTPPASSPPASTPPGSSSPVSSPTLPTPSGTGSSSSLPVTAETGADVAPLTLYALLALVIGGWLTFAGVTRRSGRRRSH